MSVSHSGDLTIYRCDFGSCKQRYALADRGAPETPWDWVEVKLVSTMADYRVRTGCLHLCAGHALELLPRFGALEWRTLHGEIVVGPGDEDRCTGRLPRCVLRREHAGACDLGVKE